MGRFQRHEVRNPFRYSQRKRTAFLLLGGATAIVLIGYAWPRLQMDAVTAADPPVPASSLQQPQLQDPGLMGRRVADGEASYAPPEPAVLAAFLACAAGGVEHVFVPAEVPKGSRLAPRQLVSGDNGDASARRGPTVVLSAQGGYLAFYDALDESFTHLPGLPCGTVDGRPAVGRRVLGGESVQWEVGAVVHAVFGWGLSRTVVTRVASGMRPMNAVDDADQTPGGADRRRRIRD